MGYSFTVQGLSSSDSSSSSSSSSSGSSGSGSSSSSRRRRSSSSRLLGSFLASLSSRNLSARACLEPEVRGVNNHLYYF